MSTVMCTQKIEKTSDDEILMQTIFPEHLQTNNDNITQSELLSLGIKYENKCY